MSLLRLGRRMRSPDAEAASAISPATKRNPEAPGKNVSTALTHKAYSLLTKGPYSQSYGSSNSGESWIIKKAERQRIDAFKLWCWRRLLRVPWTACAQSTLKEINPEYSLEGLMLKLKLQSFSHLRQRANSQEKTLVLGKSEGKRRREWGRG